MPYEFAREASSPAPKLEQVPRGSELIDERADESARHRAVDTPIRYGFVTEVGGPKVVELPLRRDQASDGGSGVSRCPHLIRLPRTERTSPVGGSIGGTAPGAREPSMVRRSQRLKSVGAGTAPV